MPESNTQHGFDAQSSGFDFLHPDIVGLGDSGINGSEMPTPQLDTANDTTKLSSGKPGADFISASGPGDISKMESTSSNATPSYGGADSRRQSGASSPAKAKRIRVTGNALAQLKRVYQHSPCPSMQMRKQLAEEIDLPERTITVWFQNRRATLKKKRRMREERRRQGHGNDESGSEDSDGDYSDLGSDEYSETEKLSLFDRVPVSTNRDYNLIDICSITVGSWNRTKNGTITPVAFDVVRNLKNLSPKSIYKIIGRSTDMLVLISQKNLEINYFFCQFSEENKTLFRVFYPINSVSNCTLTLESGAELAAGREVSNFGEMKLTLDKPPTFAVHFFKPEYREIPKTNQWSLCEDFSVGKQVNDAYIGGSNMPHCLKGLQSSLLYMNSLILDHKARSSVSSPPQNFAAMPTAAHLINATANDATPSPGRFGDFGILNAQGQTPLGFDTSNIMTMPYLNSPGTPNFGGFASPQQQQSHIPQQQQQHQQLPTNASRDQHPLSNMNSAYMPYMNMTPQSDVPIISQHDSLSNSGFEGMQIDNYFMDSELLQDGSHGLLSPLPSSFNTMGNGGVTSNEQDPLNMINDGTNQEFSENHGAANDSQTDGHTNTHTDDIN